MIVLITERCTGWGSTIEIELQGLYDIKILKALLHSFNWAFTESSNIFHGITTGNCSGDNHWQQKGNYRDGVYRNARKACPHCYPEPSAPAQLEWSKESCYILCTIELCGAYEYDSTKIKTFLGIYGIEYSKNLRRAVSKRVLGRVAIG